MAGGPAIFVLALCLVAVPAGVVPGLLRVRGPVAYALAALIVVAAEIVLLATVTSIPAAQFTTGWMLAGEGVVAIAAVALAWRIGWRPRRPALPSRGTVLAAARSGGVVTIFAAIVGIALAVQLFQALSVVSNGWDPNSYHLSRAAYWIQNNSVTQFTGGTARELAYPPDAEILCAWTMLMSGVDTFANLVQWFALVGTGTAIYLAARVLGFQRSGSALAALLFAAMPIPIMEATTAQNENVVACFTVAALAFGIRGFRARHRRELVLAALALGLAIGTKVTALLGLPALALIFAAIALRDRPPRRLVLQAAAMALAAVVALGTYNYVSNLRNTHDLFGNVDPAQRTTPFYENSVMADWGYVDFPGVSIPGFDTWAARRMPELFGERPALAGFQFKLDSAVDDSTSAFGPVAPAVLFAVLLAFAFGWRSRLDRRALALGVLLFLLLFPLPEQAHPDLTRAAAPGIALGAPLLAVLTRWRALTGAAVLLGVAALVPSVLDNHWKLLNVPQGTKPTHALSRLQQIATVRPEIAQAVAAVNARIGSRAPIGFVGPADAWDYPFFGAHLERRVVRGLDTTDVTPESMRRRGLAGIVLERTPAPPGITVVDLAPSLQLALPR
jgi:hypothetical protein